jgi:hypothetical protein
MASLFWQYCDLIWILVGIAFIPKNHKTMGVIFLVVLALTMRTCVELIIGFGGETGFLPFWDTPLLKRGVIISSIMSALYILLSYFSSRSQSIIYFAASLSIYVMYLCIMLVLLAI